MSNKRRNDIYKEMEDYIGFLRKNEEESKFSIFKKFKKKEKIEPKPEFSEVDVSEESKTDEINEDSDSKEERKINFISKITNLFKKEHDEDDEDEDELPEESVKLELYKTQMEDDAKKALQIADSLIKKIPNFELRKFMQSEDYEVYEYIMKKYRLR